MVSKYVSSFSPLIPWEMIHFDFDSYFKPPTRDAKMYGDVNISGIPGYNLPTMEGRNPCILFGQ